MGAKQLGASEYCDICGKEIPIQQYLENYVGWDIDPEQRKIDQLKRKAYCKENHNV